MPSNTPKKAARIARDFAAIPFEDHEARILALAYLELVDANQWLRDDIDTKTEMIASLEITLNAQTFDYKRDLDRLDTLVARLRQGAESGETADIRAWCSLALGLYP